MAMSRSIRVFRALLVCFQERIEGNRDEPLCAPLTKEPLVSPVVPTPIDQDHASLFGSKITAGSLLTEISPLTRIVPESGGAHGPEVSPGGWE